MRTRVAPVPKTSPQPPKRLRQRIGSPFTSSGSRAGRLTPLRSIIAEPKPLARTQNEIACVERIGAAGPAVACGSAVNEDGGKRTRFLAERRKPPGSGAKPCRPGAKNVCHASNPKPLARLQNEIACAERICAAGPAVAYGSAVNEDGGKRGWR